MANVTIRFAEMDSEKEGDNSLEAIVSDALLALMEIASKVGDSNAKRTRQVDQSSPMIMLILLGELERWYKSKHSLLSWTPENLKRATAGFFLLQ